MFAFTIYERTKYHRKKCSPNILLLLIVSTCLMCDVTLVWPPRVQYVVLYVGMTGLTIGIAALSYEFYEKPFLKLKKKFMVVQSTNRKE